MSKDTSQEFVEDFSKEYPDIDKELMQFILSAYTIFRRNKLAKGESIEEVGLYKNEVKLTRRGTYSGRVRQTIGIKSTLYDNMRMSIAENIVNNNLFNLSEEDKDYFKKRYNIDSSDN